MELDDLQWGDVVADTGDVLLCHAVLDDDQVLVKRWRQGALDAELTARRLLAGAGVSAATLLGHGPGWLVLEDLGETIWRPATSADLTDPTTLRAVGCWFARVHGVAPVGLPASPELDVLTPELVALAAELLGERFAPLPAAFDSWRARLSAEPAVLVVGSFQVGELSVVGAGMDAMVTDLTLAHAGVAATDQRIIRGVLDEPAWQHFVDGYRDGGAVMAAREVAEAEAAVHRCGRVLLRALAGLAPEPRELDELLVALDART